MIQGKGYSTCRGCHKLNQFWGNTILIWTSRTLEVPMEKSEGSGNFSFLVVSCSMGHMYSISHNTNTQRIWAHISVTKLMSRSMCFPPAQSTWRKVWQRASDIPTTLTMIQGWPLHLTQETQHSAHGSFGTHENAFISFKIRKEILGQRKC